MPWWLSARKQGESGCGSITCQLSILQHLRAGAWLTDSDWYLIPLCADTPVTACLAMLIGRAVLQAKLYSLKHSIYKLSVLHGNTTKAPPTSDVSPRFADPASCGTMGLTDQTKPGWLHCRWGPLWRMPRGWQLCPGPSLAMCCCWLLAALKAPCDCTLRALQRCQRCQMSWQLPQQRRPIE